MPPTYAADSNETLLCLVSFFFPFRCYCYDMKEVRPGLVDGEPVIILFPFFFPVFPYFSFVCFIARCSPPGVPGGLVGYPRTYYNKSISWVQFSPSAHTRRDFSLDEKI